jgi:hypothetical protein
MRCFAALSMTRIGLMGVIYGTGQIGVVGNVGAENAELEER